LEFGQLLQLHWEIIRANTQDAMPQNTLATALCYINFPFPSLYGQSMAKLQVHPSSNRATKTALWENDL